MSILENSKYTRDILKAVKKNGGFRELKNKSVLITGGTGLIGGCLVDTLVVLNVEFDYNISIFVAARNKKKFDKKYKKYSFVKFIKYDASKSITFKLKIDYIICAASPASPELFTKFPLEVVSANVFGIKKLLDYSVINNVKKIIYISSSEVYGKKQSYLPFTESESLCVNSDSVRYSYPISKILAELLCTVYSKNSRLNINIVRPGHIYGPTASNKDQRVSSLFFYDAIFNKDLILKSSGLQKRSYCYSVDCATAILFILLHGNNGSIYNIGTGSITIKKFAKLLSTKASVELKFSLPNNSDKAKFNPMQNSVLNSRKLLDLGYTYTFDISTGIDHTFDIIKADLKN